MDGTLLTPEQKLPDGFGDMLKELKKRNCLFVPASGRQYYSLLKTFAPYKDDMIFMGDNGNVIRDGKGKEYFADLVIDNSGALSPFRASLPKEWGITAMPDKSEIFVAYRGFHKKLAGVSDPENSNRAYLKHLGKDGISWSILDPAGTVNVLIGRQGERTTHWSAFWL